MTDKVKTILDKAATTASDFHKEMKAYGEVLIASAPIIEVTEEMNDLYWKAIKVPFESDLDTETLEHITGLIGSEGASDVRQWRSELE
ncbi:hypothetical protein MnTg02_01804 [bacterium MnTg02]|nr:hypothetical protein MnTg02_01804 [bacterium MnTg02]